MQSSHLDLAVRSFLVGNRYQKAAHDNNNNHHNQHQLHLSRQKQQQQQQQQQRRRRRRENHSLKLKDRLDLGWPDEEKNPYTFRPGNL